MAAGTELSKTRLARMSDVMHGYVDRGAVAGVVSLVCRHETVHVEALGAQDLATGAPIRRDTIFRIASMTKPITAVAAMILIEEAKLRLDEPVDRWLPELADRKVMRSADPASEGLRRPAPSGDELIRGFSGRMNTAGHVHHDASGRMNRLAAGRAAMPRGDSRTAQEPTHAFVDQPLVPCSEARGSCTAHRPPCDTPC
jgi:hypothetical protein